MALVQIHGGDFGRRRATVGRSLLGRNTLRIPQGLFRKPAVVRLNREVASLQIADASTVKSFAGAAGAGLVGGLVLGPVGLLAGGLAGGNRRSASFVCKLADGRRFVGTTDRRTFDRHFMQFLGQEVAPENPLNITDEIERLSRLHEAGKIDAAEFGAAKARLLAARAA